MKHKKKIDDLYREGLKNAETPPPADSWEFISSRLPEEKQEKVLPLWMKWGGVAAVLALLLTVSNFALFETPHSEPVVNEENINEVPVPASETIPEAIVGTETNVQEDLSDQSGSSSSEKIASEVASFEPETERELLPKQNHSTSEISKSEVEAVAEVSEIQETASGDDFLAKEKAAPKKSSPAEALAENMKIPKNASEAEVSAPQDNSSESLTKELLKEEAAYAETNPEATPSKNESFLQRWRISTSAGAVYFDVRNGHTVDEQFAGNSGGSEVSMSYGVNVAYQVSEKIKIRSGVNKVNLNYSTQQVDYSAAMSSSAVKTDPAGMGILLSAQGSLDQEFGFIEVPVEVEFKLIDRKIGLNLIGGASTLFLEENRLAMTTAAFTTDLGEAQNLSDLSFSANLGLGVNYRFAPKFRLNLEPMLKYQLNTFNHSNSYYFGIYSGLSYQF